MNVIRVLFIFTLFTIVSASSYASSKDEATLRQLDASWENAQLILDAEHVQKLLADDFIWVHNHAGTVDSKADVIKRIERHKRENNNSTRARVNRDVEVIIVGDTGVVHGFTTVDRGPSPVTYHFMRTYVKTDGTYRLLANHTMAIPD